VLSNLVYKYCLDNKSEIADDRAMPDDLAKKVSEVVNNKPIPPEDEQADALEDIARDIALIEQNPQDRGRWEFYVLKQMAVKAKIWVWYLELGVLPETHRDGLVSNNKLGNLGLLDSSQFYQSLYKDLLPVPHKVYSMFWTPHNSQLLFSKFRI
jgi:hypothetical protein